MKSVDKKFNLIDCSFKLIEAQGWKAFSLEKLSRKEGIPLEEIVKSLGSKGNLLGEFSKMIDIKVEGSFCFEDAANTSPKDNLFELIMLRLEHMEIYKKALKKIIADLDQSPLPLKKVLITVTNSLDFYLELAGAYDNSFFDIFKKKVILFLYGLIFKTWLKDDSQDLSSTMAELDKFLTYSEKLAQKFKDYTPF